jgi:hypothetical protein
MDVGAAIAGKEVSLRNSCPSGLIQLKSDLSFARTCFFKRNTHGFGSHGAEKTPQAALDKLCRDTDNLVSSVCDTRILSQIEEKHKYVLEVCDLFLSSLFGEDLSSAVQLGDLGDFGSLGGPAPRSGVNSLLHSPLTSSCRFPLLPIQADRTLSGVQARGKYKEKDETESRQDSVGGGAMRAGLGFFSSMLKKN